MFSNLTQNEFLLGLAIICAIFFLGFKLGQLFSRDRGNRAARLFGGHNLSPIISFGKDYKKIKDKTVPKKKTLNESALLQTKNLEKYQNLLG